jgi:hypothetical protein
MRYNSSGTRSLVCRTLRRAQSGLGKSEARSAGRPDEARVTIGLETFKCLEPAGAQMAIIGNKRRPTGFFDFQFASKSSWLVIQFDQFGNAKGACVGRRRCCIAFGVSIA